MNRRDLISTAGVASAAVFAGVMAARAEDKPHAENAHNHPAKYGALSASASKCVLDGENNVRHCLGMIAMNDTSMALCLKQTYETIATCRALESLAALNSSFTPTMAKVVEQVCEACKKECDKFLQYEECKAMAESCKACADACRKA